MKPESKKDVIGVALPRLVLPCPFCGLHPCSLEYDWPDREAKIWCYHCGISTPTYKHMKTARKWWNRRMPHREK